MVWESLGICLQVSAETFVHGKWGSKKLAGTWALFLFPFEEWVVDVALGHPKGRVSAHTSGQRQVKISPGDCKALPFLCSLQFAWHSAFLQLSSSLLVLLDNSPLPSGCFPQLSICWNPGSTIPRASACTMLLCPPNSTCWPVPKLESDLGISDAAADFSILVSISQFPFCCLQALSATVTSAVPSLSADRTMYQWQKWLAGRRSLAPPLLLSTRAMADAAGQRIS